MTLDSNGDIVNYVDVWAQEPGTRILVHTSSRNSTYTLTTLPEGSYFVTIEGGRKSDGTPIFEAPERAIYRGAMQKDRTTCHGVISQTLSMVLDFMDTEPEQDEDGRRVYGVKTTPVRNFDIIRPDGSHIWYANRMPIRIENELYPSRRNVHQDLTDNLN